MVEYGKTEQERREISDTFDQVAELYDRYRPGYPSVLIDYLMAACGLGPDSRILEIGCGTGQATVPLVRRGLSLLCLEPGRHLAALAARNLQGLPVTIETTRFEDWHEQPAAFDALLSANAFHWVWPETGYAKAARVLKENGWLALFRNENPPLDGDLGRAVVVAYRRCAPELEKTHDTSPEMLDEQAATIAAVGPFDRVETRSFPWSVVLTSEEYLGLLRTYSDHIRLPEDRRRCLFGGVAEAIDRHGGQVVKPYLAVLWLARKPDAPA